MNRLANYVNGAWQPSAASVYQPVVNPATGETIAEVPLSPAEEVDAAARIALAARSGTPGSAASQRRSSSQSAAPESTSPRR